MVIPMPKTLDELITLHGNPVKAALSVGHNTLSSIEVKHVKQVGSVFRLGNGEAEVKLAGSLRFERLSSELNRYISQLDNGITLYLDFHNRMLN